MLVEILECLRRLVKGIYVRDGVLQHQFTTSDRFDRIQKRKCEKAEKAEYSAMVLSESEHSVLQAEFFIFA